MNSRKIVTLSTSVLAIAAVLSACVSNKPAMPEGTTAAAPAAVDMTPPEPMAPPVGSLTVKVDQPGAKFGPLFYGLMTEEINYSYDGGLYGELIQNRIFKNPLPGAGRGRGGRGGAGAPPAPTPAAPTAPVIPHWSLAAGSSSSAKISVDTSNPVNATALTSSLKLDCSEVDGGERSGIANDGFWGIPVKPNTTYTASFYAKASADYSGPLSVEINGNTGNATLASATTGKIGTEWKKYTVTLKTGANVAAASTNKFVIMATGKGTVWFNLVSLFPPTYKNRLNGNRTDIMEKMADLHPAFLRFPGGNYVEGNDLANRFDWKKTVGPLEERPGHMSPWGYRSSDGLGLLEFLNWCEDLKMQPVLAVFDGLTLQSGATTGDALKPYIQEAFDEVEYVTGDVHTTFGAMRARDGHPAPFTLHYVEIGNEDNLSGGRTTHNERFAAFYDAFKQKYPALQLIASATGLTSRKPDVYDEHYYHNSVMAALNTSKRYDNRTMYPLDGSVPKVFVGEWATRLQDPMTRTQFQTPNMQDALADAAFLTGLERNPETVIMACYAPMFVNVNPGAQQWGTDLIGYDANSSFGSASYYGQKMFYGNLGDTTLPYDLSAEATSIYTATSIDHAAGEVIVKLVNGRDTAAPIAISLAGAKSVANTAKGWMISGALSDVNTIAEPTKIVPKEFVIRNAAAKFTYNLPANAIVVLRVKVK